MIQSRLDCIIFTYGEVDVHELSKDVNPCHVLQQQNWTWTKFVKSVRPELVERLGYTKVVVIFDDIDLYSYQFDLKTFMERTRRYNLDISSPNVLGSPWTQMNLGLKSERSAAEGYLTKFVEIQLTAFSFRAWNCWHNILNPTLNPSGWFYDLCFSSFCPDLRIGVLNVARVEHLGVGAKLPNGIPSTFTSHPNSTEVQNWIDWVNARSSVHSQVNDLEHCKADSINWLYTALSDVV